MILVSDAVSLGSFALIDYLWLLEALYGQVAIAEIAAAELVATKNARIQAALSLDWIQTKAPTELTLFEVMQQGKQLDAIDTHTIALALQLNAHELLLNERLSRQVAQDLELSVIGVFGVIVAAKQRALIPSVRRLMDTLVEQAGFRISNRLYQKILRFAHEI
jgi:predicted nucleic acid-binding protein